MANLHEYEVEVEWLGNRGDGTAHYRAYGRELVARVDGKPELPGSADVPFHGTADRWNPEDLLVTALAQCHMLSYLYLATRAGVVVTEYRDRASGRLRQSGEGGEFIDVTLHPVVTVSDASMRAAAETLHGDAQQYCFIARSVNFPVLHEPTTLVAGGAYPGADRAESGVGDPQ